MNSFDRLMYDITGLRPQKREEVEYDKCNPDWVNEILNRVEDNDTIDKRREEADDADELALDQLPEDYGDWQGEDNR